LPGWSTDPGDCRDDLADVKPLKTNQPNPPLFSGTGYEDPTKPANLSFDYDCDSVETPDPSNAYGTEPNCATLLGLNCTGTGYLPASPQRTGAGINPYCGSTKVRDCYKQNATTCAARVIDMLPFKCR
jgi:hypothetical protein